MTKMAATPIYGKHPTKIYSRTSGPISTKPGMKHLGLRPIIICSNDDPGLTLTYFTARLNFVTGFSIGKSETVDFSEAIAACDLKSGRRRQLIELMIGY